MNENRLPDYLDHIQQAAADVCSFVEGLDKDDFLTDKRTQQAVIMSLIIIGKRATNYSLFRPPFRWLNPWHANSTATVLQILPAFWRRAGYA